MSFSSYLFNTVLEVLAEAIGCLKRCSIALSIKEMQVKTTLRSHLTLDRIGNFKMSIQKRSVQKMTAHSGKNVEWRDHLTIFGRSANL